MELPSIHITDIDSLPENIDFPGNRNAGVVIDVHGDLDCVITFLLNEQFAKVIAEELSGEQVADLSEMNEMQESSIREVGNIMGNDIKKLNKLPLKSKAELATVNEMYKTLVAETEEMQKLYDQDKEDAGLKLANGKIEKNAVKMRTALNTIIGRAQTRATNKNTNTMNLIKQQRIMRAGQRVYRKRQGARYMHRQKKRRRSRAAMKRPRAWRARRA